VSSDFFLPARRTCKSGVAPEARVSELKGGQKRHSPDCCSTWWRSRPHSIRQSAGLDKKNYLFFLDASTFAFSAAAALLGGGRSSVFGEAARRRGAGCADSGERANGDGPAGDGDGIDDPLSFFVWASCFFI